MFVLGSARAAAPQQCGIERDLTRFEYTEYHMGVDVRIVAYAADRAVAERGCAAAFERFAELDTIMSDYRPTSELMRLCARSGGTAVSISSDLYRVLKRSKELARRSGGAFDVTCGPIVRLWRKARKARALPSAAEVEHARALTGWRRVEFDEKRRAVRLRTPGMQLDLGAIAKGYAADCAQAVLRSGGITRALIEAGGDIVVSGAPPGEPGWKIQVPNSAGQPGPLRFANAAISTSGDLEQSTEIGDKRYSHVVDPRTGYPLTDRIQVTIIARDGMTSDSLSTAISVLGRRKGLELARLYRVSESYIRNARPGEVAGPRSPRLDQR